MSASSFHTTMLVVFILLSRCGAGQSPASEAEAPPPDTQSAPEAQPAPEPEPDAAEPQAEEEKDMVIHFKAKVLSIAMGVDSGENTVTAAVDPRYSLKAKILSVEEEGAPFAKGDAVTFAIHSPAKLFMGGEAKAKGKSFTFVLHGRLADDGTPTFYHMELGSDP